MSQYFMDLFYLNQKKTKQNKQTEKEYFDCIAFLNKCSTIYFS